MLRFNEIARLFRCSLKSPTRPFPYWRHKKHKDRILKRNDFSASIKRGSMVRGHVAVCAAHVMQ